MMVYICLGKEKKVRIYYYVGEVKNNTATKR